MIARPRVIALSLLLVLGASAVLVVSCATDGQLKRASSGEVGCSPDDIEVSAHDYQMSGHTWEARCNDRLFFCTADNTTGVSCSAANESGGGCSYDTQCKGDRICRDGACVDP